jgi:hypothetical protein
VLGVLPGLPEKVAVLAILENGLVDREMSVESAEVLGEPVRPGVAARHGAGAQRGPDEPQAPEGHGVRAMTRKAFPHPP